MFSYKKVGGLHFIRVWRVGFSFYIASARPRQTPRSTAQQQLEIRYN